MKKESGLWIDHRKAVIVTISGSEQETKQIPSNMEKHVRFSSGNSEDGSSEDVRDRRYGSHLNSFYDEVITALRGVDSILIFGPGEAKGELVKRLEKSESSSRIVCVETVDKMTDNQVAERVRQQFQSQKKA